MDVLDVAYRYIVIQSIEFFCVSLDVNAYHTTAKPTQETEKRRDAQKEQFHDPVIRAAASD